MRLSFQRSFEFGIPEIDTAHRWIFDLFNEIGVDLDAERYDSALRQVIHLIAVERVHVRYETKILNKYNADLVDSHNCYHAALFNSLNDLMVALGDQDRDGAIKHFDTLYNNIIDDVLEADLPFKSLFQDRILNR